MARTKDRMKALFPVLATGDSNKIREEASKLLQEIQYEISSLNKEGKLIRELLARYGGAVDGLSSRERSTKVRDAALALARSGHAELSSQEVIDHIADQEGIAFDVKRPASMAGTVLSQMPEFERIAMNRFQYIGEARPAGQATEDEE
ncbi:MAG: hypothetical protein WBD55_10900 [Dehalococcoidia bacterium]